MVSQAELILIVIILGSWSYLNLFRDGMGPFKPIIFLWHGDMNNNAQLTKGTKQLVETIFIS